MKYWLVKTEPETYSWLDLVRQKKGTWDGVRNYAARNNLRSMKKGDKVFIYHSVQEKAIVGVARVIEEAFPDPTTTDPAWVAVRLTPEKKLQRPVSLEEIKHAPALKNMKLLSIGRLSVSPVMAGEWKAILKLSEQPGD